MRIAICDYAGHPFQVQLSRSLASRGHDVLHLYSADLVGPKGAVGRLAADPDTFAVEGLATGVPVARMNLVQRRRQEAQMGKLFAARCRRFQPDVIVSANMPLDAQTRLMAEARRADVRFVFWLQDIISVAMEKILGKRHFAYRLVAAAYGRKERRMLRQSDAVVAISDDFVPILRDWHVDASKIHVIPNWAPIQDIPVGDKANDWARRLGLTENRVVLYAGTLGLKHNPQKIVDVAVAAAGLDDVRILVASEGVGADYIRDEAGRAGLKNLISLPFQSVADFAQMLATADVLVVLIEKEAGIFSVPSKLLSYLCAGRSVLLSVPRENLAARIVDQGKLGIVVDPDDDKAFVSAALDLIGNTEARLGYARAARHYAEDTFEIGRITDRFEDVIHSAAARPASATNAA